MKILNSDYRKGFVKVKVDNLDDLWYLSHIIESGDIVSSYTTRKIKLGEGTDRKAKIIIKKVFLKLKVEKTQFSITTTGLRVSGTISEGKEDIPSGSYHTFTFDLDSDLEIQKPKAFFSFQIQKIKDASENKSSKVMICSVERGVAYFALLKKYGYDLISVFKGDISKKQYDEGKKVNFFSDVVSLLREYVTRYDLTKIVLGSPDFWKSNMMSAVNKTDLKSKVSFVASNQDGENSIKEILYNEDVKNILDNDQFSQELILVEKLLTEISRDGKYEYGLDQVENASNMGATELLLVTDDYIRKVREEGNYERVDSIMTIVDSSKGTISIISSGNDAGRKLDSLGGIGAILRYKL